MLQINIDLKKVFYVALGFGILYAISRAYKMQDAKTESVKKLILDKNVPYELSANIQNQVDDLHWQIVRLPTQGGGGAAVSNVPFAKPFAAVLTVSVPATQHLKTNVTNVMVLDSSGNALSHGFNVNPATQDVTVTFTEAETGTVYVS
jgi:hypothetical protein